jgi:hypothetical protein
MKRLLFVGAACAALLVPSLASGSPASSVSGHAKRGGEFGISFTLIKKDGKPKKITNLAFENAVGDCESGGSVGFSGFGFGPYRINRHRKFGDTTNVVWSKRGNNGSVAVKGEVNRRGTKITGTLRARGDTSAASGCDTGKIAWIAKK